MPPTRVEALAFASKSVPALPPGIPHCGNRKKRLIQVASPAVAWRPRLPVLLPSPHDTVRRCRPNVEFAGTLGVLTTNRARLADVIVAPVGIWLATSNFRSARFLYGWPALPAVVPAMKSVFAPRLLFGVVSKSVVSATGRRVTDSARAAQGAAQSAHEILAG